jgi:membrane-bound ClpP family serine protease
MEDFMIIVETLGIIATLCVIVSFLFKDIKTVRAVNMLGSFLFILYGIALVWFTGTLVGFISIFLVNGTLLCINAWYLFNTRHKKEELIVCD